MSKHYIVNCYTCHHNGQETCKGCNTLLNGEDEPYENWQLREDLETKDQRIAELEEQLKNAIVPKFKIGQEVYAVNVLRKDCIDWFIINEIGYCANYGIYYKTNQDINLYEYYFDIFATEEEAQAKLEELQGE